MKTIETERLLLRPFTTADLDAIYAVLSRREVWQYDPGKPRTYEETREVLQRWIDDFDHHGFGRFAILNKADGTLIGYCGLQWLLLDHGIYKSPEVEIFYALSPEVWGQGYITEAAKAVIGFAFTDLKLRRIVSTAVGENRRSMGVMRRIGMRVERDPFDQDWILGLIDNPSIEAFAPLLVTTQSH